MGYSFLGTFLHSDKGATTIPTSSLERHPLVCLLFSGEWAPPCKIFVEKLSKIYYELNDPDKKFEVVFISQDLSEEDYRTQFNSMPWLSTEYDQERSDGLAESFEVEAIPTLVVMNTTGGVKTSEGREEVRIHGKAAIENWINSNLETQESGR